MKILYCLLALPLAASAQATLTNSGSVLAVQPGATLTVGGNLLNQNSGTLTNAGRVLVRGDLTNAATFTSSGRLIFTGPAAQTLTPGTATISRVQLTNTGPAAGGQNVLTVAASLTVTDSLVLRQGLVRTPASVFLDLPATGVLAGEAPGRYVQGNLRTLRPAVRGPVDFGLGLTLDATGQNRGTVTVLRTAGLQTPDVSYGQNLGGAPKSIDRIYTVSSEQAPTAALPLTLAWLPDDDNGLPDFSQATPWRQNAVGAPWVSVGPTQNANTTRQVSASAAALGRFTVSTPQAPLPVTLVSFTAERQGADGLLRWVTALEINNAYFQVESSVDGTTFRPLGQVAGQGTTSQTHSYQFTDAALARYGAALVYYRLRQVDTNGQATYSPVRTVQVPLETGWLVQAYPNPSALTADVTVLLRTDLAGAAQLSLTDAVGRQLGQQTVVLQPGTTTLPLEAAPRLAAGVYVLRVQQGIRQQTLKLVRQ